MVTIVRVELQHCSFFEYVCIKAGHDSRMKVMHVPWSKPFYVMPLSRRP